MLFLYKHGPSAINSECWFPITPSCVHTAWENLLILMTIDNRMHFLIKYYCSQLKFVYQMPPYLWSICHANVGKNHYVSEYLLIYFYETMHFICVIGVNFRLLLVMSHLNFYTVEQHIWHSSKCLWHFQSRLFIFRMDVPNK